MNTAIWRRKKINSAFLILGMTHNRNGFTRPVHSVIEYIPDPSPPPVFFPPGAQTTHSPQSACYSMIERKQRYGVLCFKPPQNMLHYVSTESEKKHALGAIIEFRRFAKKVQTRWNVHSKPNNSVPTWICKYFPFFETRTVCLSFLIGHFSLSFLPSITQVASKEIWYIPSRWPLKLTQPSPVQIRIWTHNGRPLFSRKLPLYFFTLPVKVGPG